MAIYVDTEARPRLRFKWDILTTNLVKMFLLFEQLLGALGKCSGGPLGNE